MYMESEWRSMANNSEEEQRGRAHMTQFPYFLQNMTVTKRPHCVKAEAQSNATQKRTKKQNRADTVNWFLTKYKVNLMEPMVVLQQTAL